MKYGESREKTNTSESVFVGYVEFHSADYRSSGLELGPQDQIILEYLAVASDQVCTKNDLGARNDVSRNGIIIAGIVLLAFLLQHSHYIDTETA